MSAHPRGANGHRRRRVNNRTHFEEALSPAEHARSVTEIPLNGGRGIPRPKTTDHLDRLPARGGLSPERMSASFAFSLPAAEHAPQEPSVPAAAPRSARDARRRKSCQEEGRGSHPRGPHADPYHAAGRMQRCRPPHLAEIPSSEALFHRGPPTEPHLPSNQESRKQYLGPAANQHRNGATHKKKQRKLDFAAPVEDMTESLAEVAHFIIVENRERRESCGTNSLSTMPTVLSLTPGGMEAAQLSPSAGNLNFSFTGRASNSPASESITCPPASPDGSTTRKFDLPPSMQLPVSVSSFASNPHRCHQLSPDRTRLRREPELAKRIQSDLHELYENLTKKLRFGDAAPKIFTASLVYLRRISMQGVSEDFAVDERNYKRLCTVAILLATKLYIEEHVKVNIKFAEATGIPLQELNHLEIEFLHLVDFGLLINEADFVSMFDWVESVAQKRGVTFSRPPQSPGSSVTSLSTPLKSKGGSGPSTSAYELTPEVLARAANAGNISPCSIGNQSFLSPKLFTAKFIDDDASPLSSPRKCRGTNEVLERRLELEAPFSPSSGDACAFFQHNNPSSDSDGYAQRAAADRREAAFSPPTRPMMDSDSDNKPYRFPPPRFPTYSMPKEVAVHDPSAPLVQLHGVDDDDDIDEDEQESRSMSRQQRVSRADACPY